MGHHNVHQDLVRFTKEHRELQSTIGELRQWIHDVCELGIPHFGEMADRLKPFSEQLSRHFTHEEDGSYLAVAPEMAEDADELLLQHTQLLNQLEALMCRLAESDPPFETWQDACAELEDILAGLASHEHREMEILQSASSRTSA